MFLIAASKFWIEPELVDMPGANVGNAFGWIVYAAPIPAVFILGDLAWMALKTFKSGWADRARYTAVSLLVLACWAAAYLFDNMHHGV